MRHKICRVVMTTGVSVWGGQNQYRSWALVEGFLAFPDKGQNPEPPSGSSESEALKALKSKISLPDGVPRVMDPKKVAAEYSGLVALRADNMLCEHPQVVLIHTDSFGGITAATLVMRLLEREFEATVECKPVSLDVSDRDRLRNDLGNFMQVIATALRDFDTSTTCFMPLGGYKVMTSLGYLAGAYFGFPTLYTHEDNQILHEIPAVPVQVPRENLERLAPLMKRIGNGAELGTLGDGDVPSVEDHSWLFEITDNSVAVNAFGLFLMKQPQNLALFATRVFASDQVRGALQRGGHDKFILKQLRQLTRKLSDGSTDQDLQHEMQWSLRSNQGLHAFKGASNGVLTFRCLYRFVDDTLYVEHVWTDHDNYVHDIRLRWDQAPTTPHNLTEQVAGADAL